MESRMKRDKRHMAEVSFLLLGSRRGYRLRESTGSNEYGSIGQVIAGNKMSRKKRRHDYYSRRDWLLVGSSRGPEEVGEGRCYTFHD